MADKETTSPDSQNVRAACTECSRRKQKCNREWPCNHCQKRKVADQCRFKDVVPTTTNTKDDKTPPLEQSKKREREISPEAAVVEDEAETETDGDDGDFEKLGYAPGHFIKGMREGDDRGSRREHKEYFKELGSCPPLQRAVDALPPRPYTDSLVRNFFRKVNYHYYIIYPNSFLTQYQKWWSLRTTNAPLSLQWTALLLQICACSAQYIPEDLQRKLATDLGATSQVLTEKYHAAARDLQSAIPVGSVHILNVQSLLHSCYWYKSEAQFVECWHVLSSAIREAQELGIHKEGVQGDIPEFERELHRRVWVVLDTWDWQISALLSRPMIIDRTDIDVGLPSLALEPFKISPLLHMKMQSQLITKLSKRFGLPKNVTSPSQVKEYQTIMQDWMDSFPATFDLKKPDTSDDTEYPWIELHRHYLHTMGYSMMLDPIRAYLAKPMDSKTTPEDELKIRRDGIDYALKIMNALYSFFDHVWPRDAKFHFVIFCIFDTAAVYSSVIMHDQDASAPRRPEMIKAMDRALGMVKRLAGPVPAAGMYHQILQKLYHKTIRKMNGTGKKADAPRKKARKLVNKDKDVAVWSNASATSVDGRSLRVGKSTASTTSSAPRVESIPAQILPQPTASTVTSEQSYDFNPTPFLTDPYPLPDPTLFNGAACILDGGGFPLIPPAEFTETIPPPGIPTEFVDPGVPEFTWAPMSETELGPLRDMWRWQSLDLGLVNPSELALGNGAYGGFHGGGLGVDRSGRVSGNGNGVGSEATASGEQVNGFNGHANGYAGNGQPRNGQPF